MEGFKEGYNFFKESAGTQFATTLAAGETESQVEYVEAVENEIAKLFNDLNGYKGMDTPASQLQGNVAEFWQADTFNIDAVKNGSTNRASVPQSNSLGSSDIDTNFGDKYGLKYYHDGVASAKQQAKSIFERYREYKANGGALTIDEYLENRGFKDIDSVLNDPLYLGQKRLIPADQLQEATEWLKRKIAKEGTIRPEQVARYKETLQLLTDRLKDNEGNESIPLRREDAEKLAALAKGGKVSAEEIKREIGVDLSTDELLTYEYILNQALKAGMTASTISLVLKLSPEIINAIKYLIQTGQIDGEQFKRIGFAAVSGAAEGFIRGTVSASIIASCKAGFIGEAFKSANPSVVAMSVVIVMNTIKNAYYVATGKMSRRELADKLVKDTFIATVSVASGMVTQTLLLELPALGFMLGSFVGTVLGGIVYSGGYKFALSFCADTGFTMFGLVRQDYSLPNDVMEEIGLHIFEPTRYEPTFFKPTCFEPTRFEPTRFQPTTIMPYFLRRGVIGIREIGYV